MNLACKLLVALSLLVAACSKSEAPTTSTNTVQPSAAASPQASASAAVKPGSEGAPLVLEPGKGIGAIRLGMSRDEVEALGLPTRTHPSGRHGPNVRRVGPYRVEFDEGKVASVAVNLRRNESGIRIGTEEFDDSSQARDVASALPGCKAPEQGRRGMMIECDEGRVVIRMHASCVDFDDAGVCTGYDPRRMGLIVQVRDEAKFRDEAK
jgi:hypothetical protein